MSNSARRIPMNGTFELTGRCNLSCKMCLVRVDCEKIKQMGLRERTASEWIDMAEQARDAGTIGLLLTGGEVTLRPDFPEIYEAIAKMGFVITVYTNATMITDKIMELWRRLPPHKIGVTMYGASNETYGKLCGCPNGFDKFADGVRKLKTLPSLLETRTTIIKDNLADLSAMREFTKKEFGEDKNLTISRFVMKSVRGGVSNPDSCRLSPEQNVEMCNPKLAFIRSKVKSGEITLPENMNPKPLKKIYFPEGRYMFEQCKAGINEYSISWSGDMYACEILNEGCTHPFREGFIKAWERLPEVYPKTQRIEKCADCEIAEFCNVCPAYRLGESGSWFGVPEYSCKEAAYMYKMMKDLGAV